MTSPFVSTAQPNAPGAEPARYWRLEAFLALAFVLAPQVCWCQIYVGSEPSTGAIVLSNFETAQTPVAVVAQVSMVAASAATKPANTGKAAASLPSDGLRRLVESVARQTQVSPELIHAVIRAESRYDPKAVSNRGAVGLMQLLPSTGKRFGAEDLFSVEQNVLAGASYLKWLMGVFGEDTELVLAAYNAGEQAVIRAGRKVPPYPETQAYVRSIMASLAAPAVPRPQ